ncbi:MAG: hypothetical protein KGD57_04460 [Candidatus Lokiarchaeota archaeon]|nr:hypothetical protein [Candidatus Lokiarchaeota archaeon]
MKKNKMFLVSSLVILGLFSMITFMGLTYGYPGVQNQDQDQDCDYEPDQTQDQIQDRDQDCDCEPDQTQDQIQDRDQDCK